MEVFNHLIRYVNPFAQDEFSFEQADKRLFRYLVFCFILANDADGLKQLFEEVKLSDNKFMWISHNDIQHFETLLYNGILGDRYFRYIYENATRKLLVRPAEDTNEFHDDSRNINFLELACVLKPGDGSTDTIPVLISCTNVLDLRVIKDIINNPHVGSKSVEAIISSIVALRLEFYWPPWIYRLICDLDKQYACTGLRNLENNMLSNKQIAICEALNKTSLESYMIVMKSILSNAAKISDSNLFRYCLNCIIPLCLIDGSLEEEKLKLIFIQLCNKHEYYRVHIFVQALKSHMNRIASPRRLIDFMKGLNFRELCCNDLFLAWYLLEHSAVNFDNARIALGSEFDVDIFLFIWLYCSYDRDPCEYNRSVFAKWDFTKVTCSMPYLSLVIGILCELKNDGWVNRWFEKQLMLVCLKSHNLSAFRALIINNIHLNVDNVARLFKALHMQLISEGVFMSYIEPMPEFTLDCLRIMLLSGSHIRRRLIVYYLETLKQYILDKNIHVNNKAIDWLETWYEEPHSLRFFCRKTLRLAYGSQLKRFIRNIDYPKQLKDYIQMKTLLKLMEW